MWRIASSGMAPLHVVEREWSLTDACAAHTILDMREDLERYAHARSRRNG